ncbi:MAG: fimbrillin family protein [Bacteroidales bacterium]|nr:fimbrillin family protein [Bacteroidales bacterium]MCL2133001.1 fimbrillin family protein [Bacteroidales bacterium]
MKRILLSLVMLGTAITFMSCEKENNDGQELTTGQTITVIAQQEPTTRVYIDGLSSYWSPTEESIGIFIDAANTVTSVRNAPLSGTTTDGGLTVAFSGTITAPAPGNYDLYAYYPHGSVPNGTMTHSQRARVLLPITQYPTLTSFDPQAAIMAAGPVDITVSTASVNDVSTNFSYAAAFAKIIFENVATQTNNEPITSFKITTPYNIAGRMELNLHTGEFAGTYSSPEYTSKSIEVLYDVTDGLVLDGLNAIYIGLVPTSLAQYDEVNLVAETENFVISKTLNIPDATTFAKGTIKTLNITEPMVLPKEGVEYFKVIPWSNSGYKALLNTTIANNFIGKPLANAIFDLTWGQSTGNIFIGTNAYGGSSTDLGFLATSYAVLTPLMTTPPYTLEKVAVFVNVTPFDNIKKVVFTIPAGGAIDNALLAMFYKPTAGSWQLHSEGITPVQGAEYVMEFSPPVTGQFAFMAYRTGSQTANNMRIQASSIVYWAAE